MTLFVGAGIGQYVVRDGATMPAGTALAHNLAAHFKVELQPDAAVSLQQVSEIVEIRHGRDKLDSHLRRVLSNGEPTLELRWLFSLPWKAIFTTNYDDCIERCYELADHPSQHPVPISIDAELVDTNPGFEVPIYHLHGSLFRGDRPYALITQSDYAKFTEYRRMMFDILRLRLATTPVLYVGYSHQDPNWRTVVSEMAQAFGSKSRRARFA